MRWDEEFLTKADQLYDDYMDSKLEQISEMEKELEDEVHDHK